MKKSTRNPVMHNRKPSVYAGGFQVTDVALKNYGTEREKFGTTDIILPNNSTFNVKDYQYILENGEVGMYLLPINEYGVITDANGKQAWASQLVDTYIRKRMNLTEKDPIYALIYFIHPELNKNTIAGFSKTEKVEMGITHLGAYYGQGVTSNSPPLYHHRRWGVEGEVYNNFGYPCNLMVISLEGVNQAVLNSNFLLTDKILNYGIRFPQDYKSSQFRMIDINTCLMFYRDWLMEEDYLKKDASWFTYCAAHKTLVTTVALNLPHNKKSFMEVYGDQEGAEFYDLFCKNYFEIFGEIFTPDLETDFVPLWKKEGLTPKQIKPFTYQEYCAYDNARRKKRLDTFTGFRPLAPTQGTGWSPQFSADIIFDFVDAYADFIDAGAVVSCATVMAYMEEVIERMAITKTEFLMTAMPILETVMLAHAMVYAPLNPTPNYEKSTYYVQTFEGLYVGFGGDIQTALTSLSEVEKLEGNLKKFVDFLSKQNQILPEYLAWWSLGQVRKTWSSIISKPPMLPEDAYDWMREEIKTRFSDAQRVVAPTKNAIEFNTPPAIAHLIGIGMFNKNKHTEMKTICTVMDYTELEPKKE